MTDPISRLNAALEGRYRVELGLPVRSDSVVPPSAPPPM